MIQDTFDILNFQITVLYDCTCDDIPQIIETLKDINCPNYLLDKALDNLESCALNIGLTYTNSHLKSSIIVIGKTDSAAQLINTISHEHYHLISHISKILDIDNEEKLATIIGDLNMRSYNFIESRLSF